MIVDEFIKLDKRITLEQRSKFSLILNLLLVKYEIRDAFCWIAPRFPKKEQYPKNDMHWSDFDIEIDGEKLWLKELKEIAENLQLDMDMISDSNSDHMEFNHELVKKKFQLLSDSDIDEIENKIFSDLTTFWIASKEKLNQIKNSSSLGNFTKSQFLNYPRCCGEWFVDSKTKFLIDSIDEYYGTTDNFSKSNLINFSSQNFINNQNYNYEKRINEMQSHAIKSNKQFPFVFHHACDDCMKESDSPTAKLNKKYEKFTQTIDSELYQYLKKYSVDTNF